MLLFYNALVSYTLIFLNQNNQGKIWDKINKGQQAILLIGCEPLVYFIPVLSLFLIFRASFPKDQVSIGGIWAFP